MAGNIYVALAADGTPVAQRTTPRTYASASSGGGSFSAKPVNPNHPLRVQLVTKALEWVLTVPMSDGTTHVEKSKAGPFSRLYRARVSRVRPDGVRIYMRIYYFDNRAELDAWIAREANSSSFPTVWTFVADGTGALALKNWPQV